MTEDVKRVSSITAVKSLTGTHRAPSMGTVADNYYRASKSPRPQDLPLDYTSLLTTGLLEDFLDFEGFRTDDIWPWYKAQRFSNSVNPYSTIACCALFIGGLRSDHSLMRVATESYHHAIRFVRFHSSDARFKNAALALVIATIDLGNYEV